MTNDFNPARGYLCQLNYTVTRTDYIPPLYHLTGYLAYNPIENTSRLTLPGHIPDLREFLAHRAPPVLLRPYGSGPAWCSASSPWPMLPLHLVGRLTSSTIGSAAVLLRAYPRAPPCISAGSLMATRPEQRPASPAELARAVVRGLAVNPLQMRASPPQGDPLTFLHGFVFQKSSSPNYHTVRLSSYPKCRVEAFCSPSRSPPAERGRSSIPHPAGHWHLEDCSSPA